MAVKKKATPAVQKKAAPKKSAKTKPAAKKAAKKASPKKPAAKKVVPKKAVDKIAKKARAKKVIVRKSSVKKATAKKAVAPKAAAKQAAAKPRRRKEAAPAAPKPVPAVAARGGFRRGGSKAAPKKAVRSLARPPAMAHQPTPAVAPRKKGGPKPLDGIVVLDLTRSLPGPVATQMLANFGAQVIKIEEPGLGDPARVTPPLIGGAGAVFEMTNRGKQSIALKLKDARGKDAFLKLVKKADVLVESSRLGEMKKLGFDYEKLRKINRRLVYASLTGYGQSGPYAKSAGHDINFLSTGGALDLLGGDEGSPAMPGFEISDLAAGALPTVIGVLLALAAREKNGRGQMVDVSMLDGVVGMLPAPLAVYAALRRKPLRGKDRLFGKYACYNIYPARNGRYMAVGALEPAYWAALCKALDREDLIEDQFAEGDRQQVLIAELTRAFQRKEVRDWLEELQGKDACVTEVRDISDAAHDEHLIERGIIVQKKSADGSMRPYLGVYPKLIDTPGELGGPAPRRGQHTRAVLRELGLPVKRIDEMVKRGSAEEPEK